MLPNSSRLEKHSHYTSVRRVLWAVLMANLAVAAVKLMLGFTTGALAVIADGFHSLVDSSTNLIGLAAIRLADRPADEAHPYGYSRYETIGTLVIGGMLLVAAYEVVKAVVERLFNGSTPELTPLTFWLVVLTFPINLAIYLLERRAGEKLDSQVLLADAAHTRADLVVTASVIVSLLGVQLGWAWFDLVTASAVAVVIGRAAFGILKNATSTLSDRIAIDPERVEHVALDVPGVVLVHHIRSRGAPGSGFVDLHVKVHSGMTTEQAHAIATEVERRLGNELPEIADALVHIEPSVEQPGLMDRIRYDLRQAADGMGLGFHDLHVRAEDDGSYLVELHLEMPPDISLGEAHGIADAFEARVAEGASRPFKLIAHLEPVPDQVLYPDPDTAPDIRARVEALISDRMGAGGELRDLQVYRLDRHVGVAVVLTAPSSSSLSDAHTVSETIERELLNEIPEIHRVTVHVEPGPM